MKDFVDKILKDIDAEISKTDMFGRDAITEALHLINYIEPLLDAIKERVVNHSFNSVNEEIQFFKVLKPKVLSRLIYFNKIYAIESKFPNGSNDAAKKYINDQLHSLEYYFNRHLDFYQYYRSFSTVYDDHYFVRRKRDPRLCTDSSRYNNDPQFSTVYDYKVAKILANEMLKIYLNKRLLMLEHSAILPYNVSGKNWTGLKNSLVELGYAIHTAGDVNHGNIDIKEIMDHLGEMYNVDLGDFYRTYIALKSRKKDRTAYLTSLIEKLTKRMDEDESK